MHTSSKCQMFKMYLIMSKIINVKKKNVNIQIFKHVLIVKKTKIMIVLLITSKDYKLIVNIINLVISVFHHKVEKLFQLIKHVKNIYLILKLNVILVWHQQYL